MLNLLFFDVDKKYISSWEWEFVNNMPRIGEIIYLKKESGDYRNYKIVNILWTGNIDRLGYQDVRYQVQEVDIDY